MPQNLKPLTAMRFFAAAWVISYTYWPALGGATPLVISKGYLGVELFFVLSGFILSHVYLQRFGERRFGYAEFLWARLARIYPMHLATLVGLGAVVGAAAFAGIDASGKVAVWPSLPAQLTLTQAWGLSPLGGWNHPSWSISAEWFAYLSFPAFAAVAWPLRQRPRLAVGLAIALLITLNLAFERVAGFPLTSATILWGALRIVPCFAYGCAIWLFWHAGVITGPRKTSIAAAAAVAGIVIATQFGAPDWLTVTLFGGLILALASAASSGSNLLSGRLWVYLGEVSFAVYMVCIPWELVFERGARKLLHLSGETLPLPLWLMLYIGVVPAAMVLHHLVERPAREAMRRHGIPFMRARSPLKTDIAQVAAASL
jgi:peptidoglycan/LPS O-acetylase OafA/YrhL